MSGPRVLGATANRVEVFSFHPDALHAETVGVAILHK